jgi:hypothetical protein
MFGALAHKAFAATSVQRWKQQTLQLNHLLHLAMQVHSKRGLRRSMMSSKQTHNTSSS